MERPLNLCPSRCLSEEFLRRMSIADSSKNRVTSRNIFKKYLNELFSSDIYQKAWEKSLCGKRGMRIDNINFVQTYKYK